MIGAISRLLLGFSLLGFSLVWISCASDQQGQQINEAVDQSDQQSDGQENQEENIQGNDGEQGFENELQGSEEGNSFDEDLDDDGPLQGNQFSDNVGNNMFNDQVMNNQALMNNNNMGMNQMNQMNQGDYDNSENSADGYEKDWNPDANELNKMKFRLHFASFLAGRGEGVYSVRRDKTRVHLGPNDQFEVVGYLSQGDPVHAVKITGSWLKIGRTQYVRLRDIRNAGLVTKGIASYKMSRKEIKDWKEKIKRAEEKLAESGGLESSEDGDQFMNANMMDEQMADGDMNQMNQQENQFGQENQFMNNQGSNQNAQFMNENNEYVNNNDNSQYENNAQFGQDNNVQSEQGNSAENESFNQNNQGDEFNQENNENDF